MLQVLQGFCWTGGFPSFNLLLFNAAAPAQEKCALTAGYARRFLLRPEKGGDLPAIGAELSPLKIRSGLVPTLEKLAELSTQPENAAIKAQAGGALVC
jgi:hypothetical protein